MKNYSSRQAARKLGLLPTTLSNYILAKKIPAPKSIKTGEITVYLWTGEDIERVRKLLPKIANGRKTRYQKQQSAVSAQRSAEAKSKKKHSAVSTQRSVKTEKRKAKAKP